MSYNRTQKYPRTSSRCDSGSHGNSKMEKTKTNSDGAFVHDESNGDDPGVVRPFSTPVLKETKEKKKKKKKSKKRSSEKHDNQASKVNDKEESAISALREEKLKLIEMLRAIEEQEQALCRQHTKDTGKKSTKDPTKRKRKKSKQKPKSKPESKPRLKSILKEPSSNALLDGNKSTSRRRISIAEVPSQSMIPGETNQKFGKFTSVSTHTMDSTCSSHSTAHWIASIRDEEERTRTELNAMGLMKPNKTPFPDSSDEDESKDRRMGFTRQASGYRRAWFAVSRNNPTNRPFRISNRSTKQKSERIETFFYNCGMELVLGVLFLVVNILGAAHGAYQFTPAAGWTTDNDILRVTLPIARAGGRLVTINCAILLLTACKFLWTCIRTYLVPVIPVGFPIDNVMPKYHRYVALTVIFSGCVIHTLPQIVNYASKSILFNSGVAIWTFGNGFATSQLLVTGILLTIIFTTFFATTLKAFRKTPGGFRWFWFFHMLGICMTYPLLIIHGTCRGHPVFFYTALLPLAMYIFDVFMRRSKAMSTTIIGWKTFVDEGQEITELVLKCPRNFNFTPGQYAELRFTPVSRFEWHPFTIANAPDDEDDDDSFESNKEKRLVFYIKNVGRWTGALFNYASAFSLEKATRAMEISIRGPHGAPAMNYFEYKHIIVIGSGVGTTPLLSIWKYLVTKGKRCRNSEHFKAAYDKSLSFMSMHESIMSQFNLFDESDEEYDSQEDVGDETESKSVIRTFCQVVGHRLDSMMVSMILFILILLGETFAIISQMFGFLTLSDCLGATLSLAALVVHVGSVSTSVLLHGVSKCARSFKFWLECIIICVDSIAFSFSMTRLLGKNVDGFIENANIYFFVFFTLMGFLHGIRILHVMYKALKPASNHLSKRKKLPEPRTLSRQPSVVIRHGEVEEEMYSVEGIVINRKYANMRFAARSLLPTLLEYDLCDVFSLSFYGTREQPKLDSVNEERDAEEAFVSRMMGSRCVDDMLGLESEFFIPGRPNWKSIFLKALSRAHSTNPCGESVGVFFCGSPAIAKALNIEAARCTAQHQYAIKKMEGSRCSCKVIVHAENF